MREKQVRENKYNDILNEKMGKGYIQIVGNIKDEQCYSCNKTKSKKCRLKIENERCINYEKMDKR